jgi:hypothetical protein
MDRLWAYALPVPLPPEDSQPAALGSHIPDTQPPLPEQRVPTEVWAEDAKRIRRHRAGRKANEITVHLAKITVDIATEILSNWP